RVKIHEILQAAIGKTSKLTQPYHTNFVPRKVDTESKSMRFYRQQLERRPNFSILVLKFCSEKSLYRVKTHEILQAAIGKTSKLLHSCTQILFREKLIPSQNPRESTGSHWKDVQITPFLYSNFVTRKVDTKKKNKTK